MAQAVLVSYTVYHDEKECSVFKSPLPPHTWVRDWAQTTWYAVKGELHLERGAVVALVDTGESIFEEEYNPSYTWWEVITEETE